MGIICCLYKGNAHMGRLRFVIGICLVNVRPLSMVVGVIKLTGIRRLRFRGIIVCSNNTVISGRILFGWEFGQLLDLREFRCVLKCSGWVHGT